MDTFETPSQPQAGNNSIQEQVDALRHLVVTILILLVVVSGTFNIYLLRQWRSSRTDLSNIKPQVTAMIADYQKNTAPAVNEFVKKLIDYSQTDPVFAQTLAKYGIKPTAAPTSVKPTATPTAAPKATSTPAAAAKPAPAKK